MKGWLNALKEYSNNKNVTECPFCHRKNVEVLEHKGKRNSVTFLCKDCGSSAHYDGIIKD